MVKERKFNIPIYDGSCFFLRNGFIDLFNYYVPLIYIIFTIIAFVNIDLIVIIITVTMLKFSFRISKICSFRTNANQMQMSLYNKQRYKHKLKMTNILIFMLNKSQSKILPAGKILIRDLNKYYFFLITSHSNITSSE